MAWVTDITCIRAWQRWLYLAVVLDPFSRTVAGCSVKPALARETVMDALRMALVATQAQRSRTGPLSDQSLRRDCGTVHGGVAEPDQALEVVAGPAAIGRVPRMAGIGADCGIAFLQSAELPEHIESRN